jgi:hypothetical protein
MSAEFQVPEGEGMNVNEELSGERQDQRSHCQSLVSSGGGILFALGFRDGIRLRSDAILSILSRADSTDPTKNLRKVLLSLEATRHGNVQYSRIGGTQHRLSALEPLPQNKLMRGIAR